MFAELLPTLDARHAAVTRLGNGTAAWRARQAEVRATLEKLFSPLPPPDRNPPAWVLTGTAERKGLLLRKLLIETRPGMWATAGLFLPSPRPDEPLPVVLTPCGHDGPCWRDGQGIAYNLVQRGFAVLGYDPIGELSCPICDPQLCPSTPPPHTPRSHQLVS